MKFFENLPKTSFESTIGTFQVSDFFTYLDVENAPIQESRISIDSKTTLLEAAAATYEDADSFWAIVAANNVINPFTLVQSNISIFTNNNKNNKCMILSTVPSFLDINSGGSGGTARYAPIGSLIFPFISNNGNSYSYGNTGFYDMDGPMGLVVDSSFYDLTITVSVIKGGSNFIIADTPATIVPLNSGGTYDSPFVRFMTSIQEAKNKVVKQVNTTDGKTIYKNVRDRGGEPTLDTSIPQENPLDGVTAYTLYTAEDEIKLASKNIQAYVPKQLGLIQASFIATKYK